MHQRNMHVKLKRVQHPNRRLNIHICVFIFINIIVLVMRRTHTCININIILNVLLIRQVIILTHIRMQAISGIRRFINVRMNKTTRPGQVATRHRHNRPHLRQRLIIRVILSVSIRMTPCINIHICMRVRITLLDPIGLFDVSRQLLADFCGTIYHGTC